MKITTIGLDLAKVSFQVHGVDGQGKTILRKSLKRSQMVEFFAQLPVCLIGMEACGSAHYWARQLAAMGHTVRVMAPQYVKPYVKRNKNDAADAEAICEAVSRPNMRFVSVKTAEQQTVMSIHRARAGFMKARTACANQIRGLLYEFGITVPQGIHHLREIHERMEGVELPPMFCRLIGGLLAYYRELDARIGELEADLLHWHRSDAASQRLAAVPGVGLLTATAVAASIGDARQFKNGRQLAASLGLVPRQHSTGGKPTLLGISKRGDVYLRTLLIHGARSVLHHCAAGQHADRLWSVQVMRRRNRNIAAVALANKNARILWALLARGERYDESRRPGMAA
jgi:transposase